MNGAATSTTGVTTGNAINKNSLYCSFQLIAAAASTVIIEVTNDQTTAQGTTSNWITMATLSTPGAGTDSFNTNAPWGWVRTRTTQATAATKVLMGC